MEPIDPQLQARYDAFDAELTQLQDKHRVVIMPVLKNTPVGIFPQVNYYDKDEIDKQNGPVAGPIKG